MKNLLKIALIGVAIYGAYKLGEKKGQESAKLIEETKDDNKNQKEFDDNEEINYLYSLISSLENKKNKTRQERDTLDLLKIKLN